MFTLPATTPSITAEAAVAEATATSIDEPTIEIVGVVTDPTPIGDAQETGPKRLVIIYLP